MWSLRKAVGRQLSKLDGAWYYRIVDRSFDTEMRSVSAGLAAYGARERNRRNRHHLVRNVHMLEKGLTMRPRRDTFATDHIGRTVELWDRLHDSPALGAEERSWVRDVLVEYVAATATSADPAVCRARERLRGNGLLEAPAGGAPGGHGPHVPTPSADLVAIEDLLALARNRRSVRWFTDRPVPREVVDAAVSVGLQSPTACNRQPYRFLVVDAADIARIGSIPMGTRGCADQIPGLIVVIGDWSAYFDERDRHLPYIDGSLAAMGLILGFEAQGIATCCINWPDIPARDRAMRAALDLPAHERVLMLLAYGHADPTGTAPFSGKRSLEDVRRYRRPAGEGQDGAGQ